MNGDNRQKQLLRKIMDADFVLHEMVLYLDGHPNNRKALDFYKKVKAERKELSDRYSSDYGPLTADEVGQDYWSWINDPWPWQNDKEAKG